MTNKDFINLQLSLPTPAIKSTVATSGYENTFEGVSLRNHAHECKQCNELNQPKGENNGKFE